MKDKISTLFVGVDVHKEKHTLVGTNIVCEKLCELTFKNDLSGFKDALSKISQTAENNDFTPLVGLEDSAGNGRAFAGFLDKYNIPVKTVNPVLVVKNRRYETHPEKSDPRDALGVAKVLVQRTDTLPNYRVTDNSDFAKDVKILVKDREEAVCEQTKLKNKLHAALQQVWGIEYKTIIQRDIFGKRALKFWLKHPTAANFKKSTRPHIEKPKWVKETDINDLPQASDIQKEQVIRLVKKLELVKDEIKELTRQLKALINDNEPHLTSYPGCAAVNAASLVAHVNDINRFDNDGRLAKYAGIAPKKQESGNRKKDKTSTRGNASLRRVIKAICIAQIGRRGNQKAKEYYRKKIQEGKTKKQALKCLMRQNVKIIFCVMKERRPYY